MNNGTLGSSARPLIPRRGGPVQGWDCLFPLKLLWQMLKSSYSLKGQIWLTHSGTPYEFRGSNDGESGLSYMYDI